MSYRISVDVGGTFTDVIVVTAAGERIIGKSLTTPDRAFDGISSAISHAAEQLNTDFKALLAATEMFVYGTTRATNAIVTRRVAKTAFVTTAGFPDTLVFKEGGKLNAHDFSQDYPKPYIARRHTFEVPERILSDGTVYESFNEAAARDVLTEIKQAQFQAVAVTFLWSISNPDHELAMGRLIEETLPGVPYTLSHKINPVLREYRRASSSSIDASLKPLMQAHLRQLETDLRDGGYRGEILVSTSIGGSMLISEVTDRPIHMAKSGPSNAPISAKVFSQLETGSRDAIVCDTGGTTFDVGLVRNGELVYSRDSWLGGQWVGDLLGISSVDIRSVGAGGGSIVWIDNGGLLRIGPQSAGSRPGPACYGLGGTAPTVSDAACVLGYFNPKFFLGGRMTLHTDAARAAMMPIAEVIGKSVEETAYDVLHLASELMIKAIHDITISEGFNPADAVLVAGGGAAGINIMLIAKELGCQAVVFPREASALSALGMQFADILREESASCFTTSAKFNVGSVNTTLAALLGDIDDFARRLSPINTAGKKFSITIGVEARYASQVWDLEVPVVKGVFVDDSDIQTLTEAFHAAHERVFGLRDEESAVEFITWRVRLSVGVGLQLPQAPVAPKAVAGYTEERRPCFFGEAVPVDTPIYKGTEITPGMVLTGPCIVEQPTTTLVVFPGMSAEQSASDNFLLKFN
ncbi:hydantoinase/oxoprolinase family protein [Agrobacterium arsenijevicii]|uniref:5-oxoprolinase n=1 Tax=Agrobacterium arsenijevicii TaxID=1585697 RepID=A0ABR5D0S6_9HYPH|nr:5-oxoprolinase [Agrobacterium arsenijevicii]